MARCLCLGTVFLRQFEQCCKTGNYCSICFGTGGCQRQGELGTHRSHPGLVRQRVVVVPAALGKLIHDHAHTLLHLVSVGIAILHRPGSQLHKCGQLRSESGQKGRAPDCSLTGQDESLKL